MPGVTRREINSPPTIKESATGVSAALVNSDRGIPNEPYMATGADAYRNEFGYHLSEAYSSYAVEGFHVNKGRLLFPIRIVGKDARVAAGGDGFKVELSKAELEQDDLNLQADERGINGTDISLEIVDNSEDKTLVEKTGNALLLKLADTSAWKKSAKVASIVLNGKAHLIIDEGDAASSVIFYCTTAGTIGNNYSVEITDDAAGGLDCFFSADGLKLTVDLGGATPTAAAVVAAVNALSGDIVATEGGDGTGNISSTVAETNLENGQSGSSDIITASYDGDGLDAVTVMDQTYLSGVGAVTEGAATFTSASTIDELTAVSDKVMPGDILVVYNGANKGAYEIVEVLGENSLEVDAVDISSWSGWAETQDSIIFAIFGNGDGEYHSVTGYLNSPGERGDYFTPLFTKNPRNEIGMRLSVVDADGDERVVETLSQMSANSTKANFLENVVGVDSRWFELSVDVYKTLSFGSDGDASADDATFTSAASDFITDGVSAGDYLVIKTSPTHTANVAVYQITEVTDLNTLEVDRNFDGSADTDMTFDVLTIETDPSVLLALIGSDGISMTLAGGVNDTPVKADYEGDSADKTGVYAITKIPELLTPNKFFCPEAPIVVDGNGLDATDDLDKSLGDFAAGTEDMVYLCASEQGLTPTTLVSAIEARNINNKFHAEFWPWGWVSDPLSGSKKLVPLVGHTAGLVDYVDKTYGLHKAIANVQLLGVKELEYSADDTEVDSISEYNCNCFTDSSGIRPYGDYLMTSDSKWRYLHKRFVVFQIIRPIVQYLHEYVAWAVQAPDVWGSVVSAINTFCSIYDRRNSTGRYGALLNPDDSSEQPWKVKCDSENNDLATTKLKIVHSLSVVNTIEEVEYGYGLDLVEGSVTVDES